MLNYNTSVYSEIYIMAMTFYFSEVLQTTKMTFESLDDILLTILLDYFVSTLVYITVLSE
jgi:hypothetical protein